MIKYLASVEIGYERIKGRRVRYIEFRRVYDANFGRGGMIWLSLPEFNAGFKYFPNTLQIVGARGKVLEKNFLLCRKCFTLSGEFAKTPEQVSPGGRFRGEFKCSNRNCRETWVQEW